MNETIETTVNQDLHISFGTSIGRLLRAEAIKLSRYWVFIAGFIAIATVAIPSAVLFHAGEQAMKVTSASGYEFAFNLMARCLDFSSTILFVMLCMLFSLDVANATMKYLLTRPITRMELLVSKYLVAAIMVIATVLLLWITCLSAGAYYYGLGGLEENGYLLFSAQTIFLHIALASLFLVIALFAQASLAIAISAHSNTTGGAIIIGLIIYTLIGIAGILPADLGFDLTWGEKHLFIPYSIVAFTNQLIVPLIMLDNLPAGIPIDSWWSPEIRSLLWVCGSVALLFFGLSVARIRKRDFTQ